jgi:hypothetical protein
MLRQKLLSFFRLILGIEQILFAQQQMERRVQKMLLTLGNEGKYFLSDFKKVKSSISYKRCAEIIALLSPMEIPGAKCVRVGKNYDGGYVMVDDFQKKIDAAYSFGISNDVSWDEEIADRGVDVFMYDHTIRQLPKLHPRFHYFKTGVTGLKKRAGLKTLGELIAKNGHMACKNLILKMDIESCEWDVLNEVAQDAMNQFSQIVVEFHGFTIFDGVKHKMFVDVLGKINQTHQSFHVHANNLGHPFWIADLVLPETLEVTYVRRIDYRDRFAKNVRQFPTEIDQPNVEDLPDIYLGDFSSI